MKICPYCKSVMDPEKTCCGTVYICRACKYKEQA